MDLTRLYADPSLVLTVSELNRATRALLEQTYPLLWVRGEISNLKRYESGHWYFALKDRDAQVRCVMFRHRNQYLDWQPEDGALVEVRALVTLFEARGEFQLNVETMRRAGLGALYEAFERLKRQLEREGLLDPARKRSIPVFPRQVGIVTSPQAAALRDVLATLRRRLPSLPVIIYPTPVQGEGAAQQIAAALRLAGERAECDVLILCRGGGSMEDLWAFNEEVVARAIAACPIPVVAGVGHETDFTIADFVADRRAPTPTAAAELVSPSRIDLLARVETLARRLRRGAARRIEMRMQQLDYLARRLTHPGERLQAQSVRLAELSRRLHGAHRRALEGKARWVEQLGMRLQRARPDIGALLKAQQMWRGRLARAVTQVLSRTERELDRLAAHLAHLNPQHVLERGYSIVRKQDGVIVRKADQLAVGEPLWLTFASGWARSRVEDKGDPR
ncbi:exodeoxyribonuclease VII large subunit [Pelomicrobium methylotrophicum]|uniref:Exodeoxyribonuclease 7 large subunit n=1 Tax=Pelomicrobium methylotrophicum TaxID=2602750 RepID=A0A5C7EWC2_9PROT|nr:exodeoxyribonuclease VII large subunit [Pelomicrobium methylotrophicum]TXF11511.1 exodeoxyribonuclease VII large subunit [Pelomicrobium methylotrophicum]